ncbi:PHO85 cyclin-5 [Malassezia pachydermatis]
MATCNQNDGSWLPSNPSEEGLEAYPHLVSSTQSTASDLSSSLARADVSPFSLNGTISSRGTSPASSTGSYKVRRSSEAFECDNDTTESQILPASKRPKHNGPSPAHESSVGAELSQTKTQVCKQNLLKLPNCPLRMSRTLFVENLVDAAVATISSIWGRFSRECRASLKQEDVAKDQSNSTLPLALFVREILRRSRTSCSTLQAALLYCSRCKMALHDNVDNYSTSSHTDVLGWMNEAMVMSPTSMQAMELTCKLPSLSLPCSSAPIQSSAKSIKAQTTSMPSPLLCGRRMFLAAIVVASKFLQDRTYSNRTWSKISGLETREIEQLERVFLQTIHYNLVVSESEWAQWTKELSLHCHRNKLASFTSSQLSDKNIPEAYKQRPASARLHRVTSENVIGQAFQFDASLSDPQAPSRGKSALARHGSTY